MVHRAHAAAGKHGPLTVRDVVEGYLEWLEDNRKSAVDARHRAKAHIYPTLGDAEAALLTTDMLRKWHVGLAKALPAKRARDLARYSGIVHSTAARTPCAVDAHLPTGC